MININLVKTLEASLNGKPCKYCGRQHTVTLSLLHPSQRTEIIAADAAVPRGEYVIGINLDEEACIEAQTEVTMSVIARTATWC